MIAPRAIAPRAEIHQCMQPDCNLRYPIFGPDLENSARPPRCARCGGPVKVFPVPGVVQSHPPTMPGPSDPPPARLLCAVLDNLRSAFNVGSIFRAADGAGFTRLHLCGYTATPEQDKVAKTALGAHLHTPWSYHANALDAIDRLKSEQWHIVALESVPGSRSLFTARDYIPPTRHVALVVGNEVVGIDPALLAAADTTLSIPMYGSKESLNVAVAFGVAAYWLRGLQPTP